MDSLGHKARSTPWLKVVPTIAHYEFTTSLTEIEPGRGVLCLIVPKAFLLDIPELGVSFSFVKDKFWGLYYVEC